ncbi:hypothetical protein COLO4_32711 [Corchorus olitorius]|uniref:Uncharacterized protein n=1 Tax=Corchorus olitorius TaxID=93759 RepID=A0A1R3GYN6_9ROSI|nr:hypothetical protein COLO4_32711 [Corchorus olitorius]
MKEVKGVEIEAAAKYNEAKRNMGKRWDPGTDKDTDISEDYG